MIGPGAEGDIAVDDLNIADGSCPQVITRGKESRYKVVIFGVILCSMFSGWNLYYPIQHIKLCFVVLKAWVEKQYKLSNLVSLSAGLGQRRSINKQNGGLGYLVFGCPLTSFVLRNFGLFEFIFPNN